MNMEKTEEKTVKEKDKLVLTLRVIAICLILAGLILVFSGTFIELPGMMSNGWVEATRTRDALFYSGAGAIFAGAVLMILTFCSFVVNRKNKNKIKRTN